MMPLGQRLSGAWRSLFGSPPRKVDRLFARYEGAQNPDYRSILATTNQGAKYDLSPSARIALRSKARYFVRNVAIVNRICDLYETYVVGPGIQFFPASSDPEWNLRGKEYLDSWNPFADIASLQGFDTCQGIIARAMPVDGESFVPLTSEGRFPRIQIIESHRCLTPPDRSKDEGKTIVDGVAINSLGRPTGYWFSEDDQGGQSKFRLVPADSVVHVFEPSRSAQYRGETLFSPVITDLHDLDDLQHYEMRAARDAAEVTNVLNTEPGSVTTQQLIAMGGMAPASANLTQAQLDAAFVGARNLVIGTGDKLTQFKGERPSDATTNLWEILENKVCQGVGIPLQIVDPSSQQGTTFRAAVDSSAAWFRCRYSALSVHLLRIVRYVLAYGIRTDIRLADPPPDWRNIQARPPRSLCVDLGYASAAKVTELAAGLTTLETLYAEQGRDWRREIIQRANEIAFIEQTAKAFNLRPEQLSAVRLPDPPPSAAPDQAPEGNPDFEPAEPA